MPTRKRGHEHRTAVCRIPTSRLRIPPLRSLVVERRQGGGRRAGARAASPQRGRHRRRGDQPHRLPHLLRQPRQALVAVAQPRVDRDAEGLLRRSRHPRHDLRPPRRLRLALRRRVPQRRRAGADCGQLCGNRDGTHHVDHPPRQPLRQGHAQSQLALQRQHQGADAAAAVSEAGYGCGRVY